MNKDVPLFFSFFYQVAFVLSFAARRRIRNKEIFSASQENINFVINLELWDEKKTYERLGINEETTPVLGIDVPSITIPVRPGRNLAIIVEVAAINFRQKKMGYNAAKALTDRVFGPST